MPRSDPSAKPPRPRPAVIRPLGAQIRRLRLERDLSQQTLAGKAGMSYKYLGRVELAKSEPGADVLVRLARALAVPIEELFATVLPRGGDPAHRFSPMDIEEIAAALKTLNTIVDRIIKRQPRPVATRASRRHRS